MTLNEYMSEALVTATYPDIGHRCIYPALGLANEAGEVLGKIKKVFRDKNGEFDAETREAIVSEVGDVLWYLAVLSHDMGFDLEQVAAKNIAKLRSRQQRNRIHGEGDNR